MRVALAVLVWVVLVGGVQQYLAYRNRVRPAAPAKYLRAVAPGLYALELTASFDWNPQAAEADPFALGAPGGSAKTPPLSVALDGIEVLRWEQDLRAGRPVKLEPVPGVKAGVNAVLLKVRPQGEAAGGQHAVRLRILRDGEPVAERTFWTDPVLGLTEEFELTVAPAHQPEQDRDGHVH